MPDIGNALNQGAEFARGLAADERKTAAYNALNNVYGPALAGDPDTAIKAQEFKQREQTNPIAVQQAQANVSGTTLDNTGKQQTNEYNALANPKKLAGLDLTNDQTGAQTAEISANTNKTNTLLPGEVAQQGAQLNQTRAQTGLTNAETTHTNVETQQGRLALNTAQAAQDRQSAMGILASLSDVASNGGDVGAKFDTLAPLIAKYEGVDPSHMAPLRAALIKDPVGTINRLSEAIQAANLTAVGANGKAGAGALAMMKFSQGQMSLKDGLQFTQQRVAGVQPIVDQMSALVPQLSSIATIRKAKAEIPGTPEYKFQQLVEQLKPNLSLDDIRTLKASGTSLGRVTNQEMNMAANAMGNMDLGQDKSTINANLVRIGNTYKVVNSTIAKDIDRIGTGGGIVAKATAPSAKFVEGKTYTDAQGNKAMFKNGQWVPVQ